MRSIFGVLSDGNERTKICVSTKLRKTSQKFRHENKLYTRSGLLCPAQKILELEEPGLRDLIKKYPKQPKKNAAVFRDNTTKIWKINVTLISLKWLDYGDNEIDLNHDPFILIDQITTAPIPDGGDEDIELRAAEYPPIVENATRLFDQISPFLAAEGESIWTRPESFPRSSDSNHLSNIPDYIGGHLSTFLYAMPILKEQDSSFVMSNCLRNSTLWTSIDEFMTYYQYIPNDDILLKLTQTRILTRGESPMPLASYTSYQLSDQLIESSKQNFGSLFPQKEFSK
ncbi:uncharacterized protein RAG0_08987 [Rhynchosporium agropyri]|uniref:Uncharacterized protein n=1 Tax=Rhynchosporium agropyri TaxID=914238 RepID=A0A1E1KT74_9HELO|nr:uncharacterized protein RAG0_08987 [Rhynchosporium agropyri]